MAKYTETQSRKVISSYGGVESIIETPKGALKIEQFDRWPFFKAILEGKINPEDFIVEDNRLLKRLQNINGFPKLKEFLKVPANHSHPNNKSVPVNSKKVISATYFPTWFYCNNCESFNSLKCWWGIWKQVVQKHGGPVQKSDFIPPKCPYCFDDAKTKYEKDGKRRRFYYELEQVRFVMTSPAGDMRDIPWERWNRVIKKDSEQKEDEENPSSLIFDWNNICCDNQGLKYLRSSKFSDLAGIRIECENCNSKSTLSGFFGMRIGVPEKENVFFKPVLRSSNSCYYPVMISSIFLPTKREIAVEDQRAIKEWHVDGESIDFIYKALRKKYEIEKIKNFIKGEIQGEFEPEIEYRFKEYEFILNEESQDENLVYDRITIENNLKSHGLNQLIAVRRLKVTTVQIAFTRQEPLDNDRFLSGESTDNNIEAKYTSEWGSETEYLPAVESFGEGIFISLDSNKIEDWYLRSKGNDRFRKRITQLFQNAGSSDLQSVQEKFRNEEHLARFVLIHTLSHILIKELEFLCGYPSTSLNERLFVDNNKMNGMLLFTVAGTEGSYGGLVSQANENSFSKILESALIRANDCASDPICYNTIDGQGVGGLNMSACYSCSLVPETACEEFNCFLDRSILIDSEYGYFNVNQN